MKLRMLVKKKIGWNKTYQGPPIDGLVMSRALNDLWGQIFWSATKRVGHLISGNLKLA